MHPLQDQTGGADLNEFLPESLTPIHPIYGACCTLVRRWKNSDGPRGLLYGLSGIAHGAK